MQFSFSLSAKVAMQQKLNSCIQSHILVKAQRNYQQKEAWHDLKSTYKQTYSAKKSQVILHNDLSLVNTNWRTNAKLNSLTMCTQMTDGALQKGASSEESLDEYW